MQLAQRVAAFADVKTLRRAEAVGLVHRVGDDRWVARSESLLALVADLVDAGAPVESTLDAVRDLRDRTVEQGNALADLYVDEIWKRTDPETAIALACMRENVIHACKGFEKTGTTQPVNAMAESQKKNLNLVLKTASGFGGSNAAIILQKA